MNQYISDTDVWSLCPIEYLWIYDKLIVAQKQGIVSAPAGIPVPHNDYYIVRPITNLRSMSRGASVMWLTPQDSDLVPDGYFWSQKLSGRHISVDYHHEQQVLAVEGFRDNPTRLDRFSQWNIIDEKISIPKFLGDLWKLTPWINVEMIGDFVIEVHLRWNDDFSNHSGRTIIPVWKDDPIPQPPSSIWYSSPCGDRLGFWVLNA
jgi:hypothetical protein